MTTLADIKEGRIVVVHYLECGRGLKKRLCDLGLYDGTKIKVLKFKWANYYTG